MHELNARAIALRGLRGVCGGVNVKTVGCCKRFRAVAHILPPGSEATRAVNMCRAWVTRAAAVAQRSLGTYKRPPECLVQSCIQL
eukprot:2455264-Prymnesium_polylepis.1